MLAVIAIAAVAVLVGVFLAATGRGGELAYAQIDYAPLDLGPVSPPDVALLRPPTALWGYNTRVTEEALDHIASAIRERDITIAYLQAELANREPGAPNREPGGVTATQPDPAIPPHDASLPSEALPSSDETPGPQGPYDTHDWWAEQEEAAREEAQRQAAARHAVPASPGESPGQPGTAPDAGRPPAASAGPPTPHDDALAVAEEQAW